MFLEFLKISKSQKHFFLKLRCPKNELNIWQKSAQLHRAEFCLIICSFFWQLSFKKNSFWDLLTFNCKSEDKRWLCFSMSDSHSENEKKNESRVRFGLDLGVISRTHLLTNVMFWWKIECKKKGSLKSETSADPHVPGLPESPGQHPLASKSCWVIGQETTTI